MSRDPDLALYRAFVAVAEDGGMTAAAVTLNLTQAAISQQIRRLEEALGCRLFLREHRNIRLTSAGETLLPKAREILKLHDEAWAMMTAPQVAGEIRLGAPTDIVNRFLPGALRHFAREFPQVDVTLVCRTSPRLIADWKSGAIDVALFEEPIGHGVRIARKECLMVDRLVWIGARHGDAVRRTPLPVSLSNDTNVLRPAMLNALRDSDVHYRVVSEVGTMETVSATVRTDLAITALLQSTVPEDVDVLGAEGGLPDLPHFEINMLPSRKTGDPVAEALCREIRAVF